MKEYDAIVIGSGQGGNPLAQKLAENGYKTALIERKWTGGTCINDGCTPTKAMIASARAAYVVKNANELGIVVPDFDVNVENIAQRKDKIVTSFRNGLKKKIESVEGLDFIHGEASFTENKKIRVRSDNRSEEELSASYIIIDTGSRPFIPPIEGLQDVDYLTSTTILNVKELPDHLAIIGGGSIGLEFAQMFKRFGSRVTLLERSEKFFDSEDEDIGTAVREIFEEEGIRIVVKADVRSVKKDNDHIHINVDINGNKENVRCTHLLIATGRVPNSDQLDLPAAGIATDDKGYIKVDDKLQTNVEGVYAIGEINGGPAFTHVSYNDYMVVSKNIIENGNATTTNRLIPYCIYIDPQLGRIGISEEEARKRKLDYKVARLPMKKVARALETGETRGLMKAIVDSKSKKILGAAILSPVGGEIMSVIQMAMLGELSSDQLRDAMLTHPSYAEALNNLFSSLDN